MLTNLSDIRSRVNTLLADYERAKAKVQEERDALSEVTDKLEATQDAQKILQGIAQMIQQQAHTQIAGVVSRCLDSVFDEPYEFKIVFEQKRGKTEGRIVFLRADGLELDPMSASEGGQIDVATFALRLSTLLLTKPQQRKVLVLDEPFKCLSAEYWERARRLIEGLAKEFDVQFIIVTHNQELKTGRVIEL